MVRVSSSRLGGALGLALGLLALGSASAEQSSGFDCDSLADGQHAAPFLVVTSPTTDAVLGQEVIDVQGAAFDCHAEVGSGISQVSVFIGPRAAPGGVLLGDAVLGSPSPVHVEPTDQYARAGWRLAVANPLKASEVGELHVYARSQVTGLEAEAAIRVAGVGPAPTSTPSVAPAPAESADVAGPDPALPTDAPQPALDAPPAEPEAPPADDGEQPSSQVATMR
jgi:hypothetical protein